MEEMMMKPRLKAVDLNPCLSCILCGGYYIDATTITECLHSFCRACIVRYLETSKYCPVCDVRVHKSSPLKCIRPDRMLQDIVYKLVPGLYQNEMKCRRELYASQPPEALRESRDAEDRGEGIEQRFIYTADEIFNLTLELRQKQSDGEEKTKDVEESFANEVTTRRFLRCPAAFTISYLKKFIRLKYSIPQGLQISVQHKDVVLDDDLSLMDVAYIISWKRAGYIHLTFDVLKHHKKMLTKIGVAADIQLPPSRVPPNQSTKLQKNADDHHGDDDDVFRPLSQETDSNSTAGNSRKSSTKTSSSSKNKKPKSSHSSSRKSSLKHGSHRSQDSELSRKSVHKSRKKRKLSATIQSCSVEHDHCPPKVPKLTISLTPKILQMAALHAEDAKLDLNSELHEGRLVISEQLPSPKQSEGYCSDGGDSPKIPEFSDFVEEEKKNVLGDDDVDSGRGSDSSSRVENEDIGSPGSSMVLTPDLEKPGSFLLPSPRFLPSPIIDVVDDSNDSKIIDDIPDSASPKRDDLGVLDLSTCHRSDADDRIVTLNRSKQVANPPVLDKFRQTNPCLPLPILPSFVFANNYKKTICSSDRYRYNRANSFTVINPDPSSCRPKIVIKNVDSHKSSQRHHHHHHHHHHHGPHQPKT